MKRRAAVRGPRSIQTRTRRPWRRSSRNRKRSPRSATPVTSAASAHAAAPRSVPRRDRWRAAARLGKRLLLLASKTVAVTLLLLGVAAAGYHGYQQAAGSTYLTVRHVVLTGAKQAPRDELLAAAEAVRGVPIFRVDTAQVASAIARHAWVAEADVWRKLPDTLRVAVKEHEPRAAVLLGHVYLLDAKGSVFKRAEPNEADGLPVITGTSRIDYLNAPEQAKTRFERALRILARYESESRPPLGEIHLGDDGEVTLFLRRGGTALRLGSALTDERLARLDAVWQALGPDTDRARAIFLDHEVRASRVVVRMRDFD